jgi:hypothetical protein
MHDEDDWCGLCYSDDIGRSLALLTGVEMVSSGRLETQYQVGAINEITVV